MTRFHVHNKFSNQDQLLNQDGDRCEGYMRRVQGQPSKDALAEMPRLGPRERSIGQIPAAADLIREKY